MKYLALFGIVFLISFSSCSKNDNEKVKDIDEKNQDWVKSDDWDGKKECFKLVFPITYLMPDGSELEISHAENHDSALKTWYEEHTDVEEKPALIYPVSISYEEFDKLFSIENEEEMIIVKKKCYDNYTWNKKEECFKLVFPITYLMPDGSELEISNAENHDSALKAWYEAHEDVETKPELQYPVQVSVEESDQLKTIENDDDFAALKKEC